MCQGIIKHVTERPEFVIVMKLMLEVQESKA